MEKNLIPKRRFNKFHNNDAWKQYSLGDVADIVGGGTPSTRTPEYWGGDIDWYSPNEIGNLNYVNGSRKKITKLGLKNSSAKILPVNTILFTSRAGIGKTAILGKEGATNQGFQSIVPKENLLDSYFIFSQTNILKKYGEINGAGSTFVEVSGKQMAKMPIYLPLINEQNQISQFLKKMDNCIIFYQSKLEKIKALKSAYLSEMIPSESESVPNRRFKGFEGEWKVQSLKDVVTDISDGDWILKGNIFNEGEYRIIQTGNLGVGKYIDRTTNAKYFHEKDFNQLKANEIFPGDILISRLAEPAGRTIILPDTGFKMVTSVDVAVIRPDKKFDRQFFMTQMNTENILNKIQLEVTGTTHKRISRKNLENIQLKLPKISEQQRIGQFFKHLDDMIAIQHKKLEKLKATKQAYLNEMFV